MEKEKQGIEEEIFLMPEDKAAEQEELSLPEPNTAKEETIEEVDKKPAKSKAHTLFEIREKRGAAHRVYRMSDQTEKAEFYPEEIHVFNEETECFEDVENTFTEEADGRYYKSGPQRFCARFSREDDDELFSIESGNHRVTVLAKKSKSHRNRGKIPQLRKRVLDDPASRDTVVFSDVTEGSDYEYSVTGSGVKENIVVREKAQVYRYSFILRMENVIAEFNEEQKRIGFISTETGEEVFYIPAPFMTDAAGVVSTAVDYEMRPSVSGDMVFTVMADQAFLNDEARVFPVTIDPQIKKTGSSAMTTYSWNNGALYEAREHRVGATGNGDGMCNAQRMYMRLHIPTLPRNPRIKKAELVFTQLSSNISSGFSEFGLYRVNQEIYAGSCTPINHTELIDYARMQPGTCTYTFDVTTLVDCVNKGDSSMVNLVLKKVDETNACCNSIVLGGSAYSSDSAKPKLSITYESTYGVNTSHRTHTHELGRFGQGSIDLQCGNLMFESEDFAWAGNRMPVTIQHLYNSALSDCQYTVNDAIKLKTANFSEMKVGHGFKLNLMQSMIPTEFWHEGERFDGYVYIDGNGNETYFKPKGNSVCCNSNTQCYSEYEDITGGDMLYDPVKRTLTQGDESYVFDTAGRLIKVISDVGCNNQQTITYTSGRISSVTDGAGRDFGFGYSSGHLTSITAPNRTTIRYGYSGDFLSSIIYPDGRKATIDYVDSKPSAVTLWDANGNMVYKVAYIFSDDRLQSVTEYGVENGVLVLGARSTYTYSAASGRTVVQTVEPMDIDDCECTDTIIKTVYTFDDDGNVVSEYMYTEDTGNVGVDGEESGIHPHSGDGGAGVVSNINNLLLGHNFEDMSYWNILPCSGSNFTVTNYTNDSYSKFGKSTCWMRNYAGEENDLNGIYQNTATLPAGEYTFSVYAKIDGEFCGCQQPGVFIRVTDMFENILAESERLTSRNAEFIRLIAPFELASAQSVKVQIMNSGRGSVDVDGAQLENNPYANAYNMLENGNFERSSGWSMTSGVSYTNATRFNMSRSMMISGDLNFKRSAWQKVLVKSNSDTRETFVLSGWAKGYGLPNHDRENASVPTFRLRANIKYQGISMPETHTADFSPRTEEWQFASVEFAKQECQRVEYITVYCDYDYNIGTAYFDDIQLIRTGLETNVTDFGVDTDTEETTTQTTTDKKTDTTNTTPAFEEAKDRFGNTITETTFTDGEFGTIYRAFRFDGEDCCNEENGNDLVEEIDPRGNSTRYCVDGETSRNEEVTDRCGNKTAYEYDDAGRTTKVTNFAAVRDEQGKLVKDSNGNVQYKTTPEATVSYAYDAFDNMTEIVRGDGMKYVLNYNAYHNLESIGIDGKTDGDLVKYTYKNGNGRLKQMTYANGDTMKATYNGIGQMVAEKWYNALNELTAHYKYVYDGQGNIVRSIDIVAEKEYTYQYEDGKLMRATEANVTFTNGMVTSKIIANAVQYFYDAEGQMTKKVITFADGTSHTVHYENSDDNTTVKFSAGGRTVTSHSKTDSFGRKVFDELQLGTGFVSRQFSYHTGEVTDEHKENEKLKSSATTNLVSQITLSGGRTIAYKYDKEERITEVDDSVDGITTYTYDALGQLIEEKHKAVGAESYSTVNIMTYTDAQNVGCYGNILSKNGVIYEYDSVWKDKLVKVGEGENSTITYDAQGNPTTYLGNRMEWEKGRQLKRLVKYDNTVIDYTYNANGIRTSKKITKNGDTVRHDYTLDGVKILRETWGNNTLVPLYDNEDTVCGILYNNEPYYFQKNLQGDIIAIVDKDAQTVARYSYDAWGVCTILQGAGGIADINPFRYRGYYYDVETKLYYLQSRYYDPYIARFLNSDDAIVIISITLPPMNQFAYCKNNCIMNNDPTGYWYSSLSHFYNVNVSPWSHLYRTRSLYLHNLQRYQSFVDKHNTNVRMLGRFTNYIESQNKYPISTLKFGSKTISWCGCELIAIYNVMKKLSKWSYFADVINECYMNGLAMLDGYFGIWPPTMRKYFNAHKISYKYFGNAKKFFSAAVSAKISIVSYWNGKPYLSSLHTVAFHPYRTKNNTGGYYAYNYRNSKAEMKTLEELKRRKFICGYIFSK